MDDHNDQPAQEPEQKTVTVYPSGNAEQDGEPTGSAPVVTINATPAQAASASSTSTAPVRPADALPAFTPAEAVDLSPLDPQQNGVLKALARIESAIATSRRAALVKGHDPAGTPVADVAAGASTGATRDAAGRYTSPQALAGHDGPGNEAGLQQKIRRVKRIERRVERTLPPAERSTPSSSSRRDGGGDGDTSVTVRSSGGRSAVERNAERRETAEATADATADALQQASSPTDPGASDDQGKGTQRALTADDLRKLALRGSDGRFLSRDEKQGMTKSELSQARTREKRDKAQQDDKAQGVMAKAGRAAGGALGSQGSAGDAAGTAAGGSYYLAAKELYDAASQVGGKDSKAQKLYRWAQKKRDESAGKAQQDNSDNARPVQQGDPGKAARQREATADAVESQADADAKQREARAQRQQAMADARESRHRDDAKQADSISDDSQESLTDLEEVNEDGFDAVVRAIKRYAGGGGGGMWPWPGGRGRGRGRGRRRSNRRRSSRRGPRRTPRQPRTPRTPRTAQTPRPTTKTARISNKAIEAAKNTRAGQTATRTARVSKGAIDAAKATRAGRAATQATAKTAQVSKGALDAAKNTAKSAGSLVKASKPVQVSKGAIEAAKATRAGNAVATTARVGSRALGTAARWGGRATGVAAAPLAGYFAYQDAQADLADRDDLTDDQKKVMAGSSAAGAGTGAATGAATGGAIGAAIGSVVPVVGTAIGGGVGAIAGGALGAWGGEKAGTELGDALADRMDDKLEEARKQLLSRDDDMKTPEKREVKWYNPSTWTDRGGAGVSPQAEVNKGPYTAGGDAELANETGFGRVAEKYESSGMGVGTVSTGKNDAGGVSYGIHQLASDTGTMDTFLASKEGEKYRDQFEGMDAGSAEFTAQYKKIAANDGDNFAAAQQDFIKRTHYDPVERYASASGFNTDSEAIQEALYSQSVQTSGKGNEKIIDDAMSRVGPDATEEEVIDAMYDARGDYVAPHVTHSAGRGRYAKEREDVKAISARGDKPEAQPEVDAAPAEAVANVSTSPRQQGQQKPTQAANDPAPPSMIAAPVEPNVEGEPVTPIDPAKAQQAFQPAAPSAPAAQAPSPARPAPAATQGPAGNDGKDGTAGSEIRGGTSSPGVNDIQMGFDDTTLTLMAMDRI